jgi:hypothetical protein
VTAYRAFTKAEQISERTPPKNVSDSYASGGDFTRYAFDPARRDLISAVLALTQGGIAFRGTPPAPRIKVTSVRTSGGGPTVVLSNCPTPAPSWVAYLRKNGKVVNAKSPGAPLPHLMTVTVIYVQNRWGVSKIVPDTKHTCEAP